MERIEIVGLRDFQSALRAANSEFPKELRTASKVAAEIVAVRTQASFAGRGGSAPKVAPTVKALAQQRGASVKIGGGKSVGGYVALGNEFGGRGRSTTQQFPPFKKGGYSLFPTIARARPAVINAYADALDRITARAFPQ